MVSRKPWWLRGFGTCGEMLAALFLRATEKHSWDHLGFTPEPTAGRLHLLPFPQEKSYQRFLDLGWVP